MLKKNYVYFPFLRPNGYFFEYHLTLKEFKSASKKVGFEILEDMPFQTDGGLLSLLNPKNKQGKFLWTTHPSMLIYNYTKFGKFLSNLVKNRYWCNHMQLLVLKKI